MKTGQLKRRISRNTLVVCSLAMTVSTVISYLYFQRIVQRQEIEDIQAELRQLGRQMDAAVEDVENFAKVIVADEDMQTNMNVEMGSTTFAGVKRREEISKRLRFYNGLRAYISGSFAESADGEHYSSTTSTGSDQVEAKFQTPEVETYMQNQTGVFSKPYYGVENWDNSLQSVCYRHDIWNQYQYGEKLGTLYLEIYLSYFQDIVDQAAVRSQGIWLVGDDGRILYEKDGQEDAVSLTEQDDRYRRQGIYRVNGGYLICQEIPAADWAVCARIDNGYLWSRSGFVLTFFVLSFCLTVVVVLFTISGMLETVIRPITRLSVAMEQTRYDKLEPQEEVRTRDEIEVLYRCYNDMVGKIRRGVEERVAYEKKTKDMEFDILLSQINPHYLYNVLHTVVYLAAAGKNKDVVQITNSLLYTLQETLKLGEKNIETTVKKELELTERYLNIQRYRYPGMFRVEMVCEKQDEDCIVPKTMIQPLVENAILHGVLPSEEAGFIRVEISRREDVLSVVIEDDGQGIEQNILDAFACGEAIVLEENGRRHIGISNIRDRITYLYGEPSGMWIANKPEGGTRIRIEIPYRKNEKSTSKDVST